MADDGARGSPLPGEWDMIIEGNSRKMKAELGETIQYTLRLGDTEQPMNQLLGKTVRFEYLSQINCIVCQW